ncbi:MAG: energy-coupling factor transporter transmembrane protein EcfT [Eubacterium sp.]|nr:energy-coupling factor transporter transmembrane protein EcfT [Eubacterium sp.]
MYTLGITKGKYENRISFVHMLDARLKIYTLILYFLMCLFAKNYIVLLVPFVILAAGMIASKVNLTSYLLSAKRVMIILFAGFLINLLVAPFLKALLLFLKFCLMAFMAIVILKTTSTGDLLRGMKKGLHVREETAMTMTVALLFLPLLGNEMNEIRVAQAARGADVTVGSLKMRLKNSISVIVPLFRKTFDKAEKMAGAMDIRCYDSSTPRTEVDPLKYSKNDVFFSLLLIIMIVVYTSMSIWI